VVVLDNECEGEEIGDEKMKDIREDFNVLGGIST
jgi:hypothetical protein